MAISITTTSGLSPGQFHGLPARLGFTHGFDIRFRLQQRAESLPHNGVIVS